MSMAFEWSDTLLPGEGTIPFKLEKTLLANPPANNLLQTFIQEMVGQSIASAREVAEQRLPLVKLNSLDLDATKVASIANKQDPLDRFLNLLYASCIKDGECRLALEIAQYALKHQIPTSFLVEGNLIEKRVPEHKQPWKIWEHEKGSLYEKAVAAGEYELARAYLEVAGKFFFEAKVPKAKHESFVKFMDQNLMLLCEEVASERGLWKGKDGVKKVGAFLEDSFHKLRHDETIDAFYPFAKRLNWPIKVKFV